MIDRTFAKHTIHVRLAGIDAPEGAHFGQPGQPYSSEAKGWLHKRIHGKAVTIQLYSRDQYHRAVSHDCS
jgi:endonuclease YncB( thermonuclease family)